MHPGHFDYYETLWVFKSYEEYWYCFFLFFFFDFVLLFMQISFFVLFLYADKFSLQVPSHLVWIVVVMPIQFSKALKCYLDLSWLCATQTPIWDLGSVLKVLLDCLELDPYRHSTGISSKVHV